MQFLRRVLGGHRASPATPPLALYDSAAAYDGGQPVRTARV